MLLVWICAKVRSESIWPSLFSREVCLSNFLRFLDTLYRLSLWMNTMTHFSSFSNFPGYFISFDALVHMIWRNLINHFLRAMDIFESRYPFYRSIDIHAHSHWLTVLSEFVVIPPSFISFCCHSPPPLLCIVVLVLVVIFPCLHLCAHIHTQFLVFHYSFLFFCKSLIRLYFGGFRLLFSEEEGASSFSVSVSFAMRIVSGAVLNLGFVRKFAPLLILFILINGAVGGNSHCSDVWPNSISISVVQISTPRLFTYYLYPDVVIAEFGLSRLYFAIFCHYAFLRILWMYYSNLAPRLRHVSSIQFGIFHLLHSSISSI